MLQQGYSARGQIEKVARALQVPIAMTSRRLLSVSLQFQQIGKSDCEDTEFVSYQQTLIQSIHHRTKHTIHYCNVQHTGISNSHRQHTKLAMTAMEEENVFMAAAAARYSLLCPVHVPACKSNKSVHHPHVHLIIRRTAPKNMLLENVSPATRLLEKRRQMFEVQEALELQKQDFARKVRLCPARDAVACQLKPVGVALPPVAFCLCWTQCVYGPLAHS